MSIDQLQKLIQESSLLSEAEKQEWLQSLEFMNDKQLQDLYSILAPKKAESSVLIAPKAASPAAASLAVPQAPSAPVASPAPQGAPLKDFLEKNLKAKASVSAPIQVALPPKPEKPIQKNAFRERLERTVSEKELPAGEHHESLKSGVRGTHRSNQIKTDDQVGAALARPQLKTGGPDVAKAMSDKQGSPLQRPPNVAPTISMSALLDATVPPQSQIPIAVSVPPPRIHKENIEQKPLRELADVANLGVGYFRTQGAPSLLEQLQKMIHATSYFEVLLRLEQSPLYKAYVTTGKNLLGNNGITSSSDPERIDEYLTKEEFEAVADLLREIKAS